MDTYKRHLFAAVGCLLLSLGLCLAGVGRAEAQAAKDVVVVNAPAQPVPTRVTNTPTVRVDNGPLAPKKASDLVTVVGGGTPGICGGIGNGVELSIPITYGQMGSPGEFVIPAGKVLVVTGWEWFVSGDPQSGGQDTVFLDNGGVTMATGVTPLNAAGDGGGSQKFGPVAFRPGRPLCLVASAPYAYATGRVYGFFAVDE
jgi:hypothetical protein